MEDKCKYYSKHLETIREYIGCLYSIDGCASGGLLHIMLDDDNYDDDDIAYCLKQCLLHPEREESLIGRLICEEYLALPMVQRRLLTQLGFGFWNCMNQSCNGCFIELGDKFWEGEDV